MSEITRQAISALLAGFITSATAIVTLLQKTPLEAVTGGEWVVIGCGGFIAAATGWRTLLKAPRKDG